MPEPLRLLVMAGAAFTRSGLLALAFAGLSAAPASSTHVHATKAVTATDGAKPDQRGILRVFVVDDVGRPLIARVRVVPSSLAERVRLGHWSDTSAVSDLSGVNISLQSGDYRVLVSCGPEWSIVSQPLHMTAGDRLQLRFTLRHQVSIAGWQGADLHVHTEHSDDAKERGGVKAADLRAEGVSLAAITDHNRLGNLGEGIDSLAGVELTTWAPEVGHFNAFPLQHLPSWHATTPARLFAEIAKDPKVFMQINHPRLEDHIGYFALGDFDGERFADPNFHLDVDGLEVWNGYDLARPRAVNQLLSEWRSWVAAGHRLTATGGSDSHGSSGHLPGYPRTYVRATSGAGLSPALKAGHAFVTNGPLISFTVEGGDPGDTRRVGSDGSVQVYITVLAANWMRVERAEIWVGTELAWNVEIPPQRSGRPLRFSRSLRLAVGSARTIHAVARGGGGLEVLLGRGDVEPLAFTNPVYLSQAPRTH